MKLVADESVDRQIIDLLRLDGLEVIAIAEIAAGSTDEDVLARAVSEQALLLTADKDFGDLVFRQGLAAEGVVLARLSGLSQQTRAEHVRDAFRQHSHLFPGAFTVIEYGGVRIRKAFPGHEQ